MAEWQLKVPAGVVPKNLPVYVALGVVAVLLLVMFLTASGAPSDESAAGGEQAIEAAVADVRNVVEPVLREGERLREDLARLEAQRQADEEARRLQEDAARDGDLADARLELEGARAALLQAQRIRDEAERSGLPPGAVSGDIQAALETVEERELREAIRLQEVERFALSLRAPAIVAARFARVTFSEITEPAIRGAFREPRRLDMALVRAQLTRRFVDRLVGWRVSPALVRSVRDARSAGRVQSVALRLVVEREREIGAFASRPYWEVVARVDAPDGPVSFPVVDAGDPKSSEPHRFPAEADARAAAEAIREAGVLQVASVRSTPSVRRAHPPFTTSSLQQAASARLKLTVGRTMEIAQSLYERGAITYMRTDSVNVSAEAAAALRKQVAEAHGDEYVADPPNRFKAGGGAQEAHEAIRPTVFDRRRQPSLEGDAARLYKLISRRAAQSQMAPARIRKDRVEAVAGPWRLALAGIVVLFPGFEAVWPPEREDVSVPLLEEGASLRVGDVALAAKRTKAPKRFTQATLVRELEKRGIGRPSTYAQTIEVLLERGYVEARRRDLAATPLGDRAAAWLMRHFAELLDYSFTADLERQLDEIAAGSREWTAVLDAFHRRLLAQVESASG